MKKSILMLSPVLLVTQAVIAQTHTVNGTVLDKAGNSVPYAFVEDGGHKYAAYSDSVGHFTITVQPDSKLDFAAPGFKDTLVNVSPNIGELQVALQQSGQKSGDASGNSSSGALNTGITKNEMAILSNDMGGYLKPAHEKGDTRGSQYLFVTFVHGYLINAAGELVQKPNYLFDYDKINGNLLLTRDNKTIIEIGWDETKSFSLFASDGTRSDFEKVPSINQSHYVQVLASGNKYKIYKQISTKFVKSDYVNNGAAAHGHDYDEYVDDATYYLVDVPSNQMQKFSTRKKGLKTAFAKEADKINKYISDNSGDIDDAYLAKLGAYMNQ